MPITYPVNLGEVLARTLWAEARGEGRAGLEAVASVVLNRAAHPRWWGRDVRSVCLAPNQFSCWLPEPVGQLHRLLAVTVADPNFKLALAIAADALAGRLVDRTQGADTYANLHVCDPAWSHGRTPCAVIGAHTFFRLELAAPNGSMPVGKPVPVVSGAQSEADALNAASLAAGPRVG